MNTCGRWRRRFASRPWEHQGKSYSRPSTAEEVKWVSLHGTRVTDAGLKHLAPLVNLTSLSLGSNITDQGMDEVVSFQMLTSLDMRAATKVTAKGRRQLLPLKNLHELRLDKELITDESLRRTEIGLLHSMSGTVCKHGFPKSPLNVSVLYLDKGKLTSAGLRELTAFENLEEFYVTGILTDVDMREIGRFKKLDRLTLRPESDAGLKELVPLKKLKYLCLSGPGVTDVGLKSLADLDDLACLYLSHTSVTGTGISDLAALPKLDHLILNEVKLSDAGVKNLTKLPHLHISTSEIRTSPTSARPTWLCLRICCSSQFTRKSCHWER